MTSDDHYRRLERMYVSAPANEYFKPEIRIAEGAAEVEVAVRPDFFHAASAVHGSVYFKLLDDATFFAASSLVHDVFVLALERLGSLREPAACPGWIASIARNRATDAMKRQPVMESFDDRHAAPPSRPEEGLDGARALSAMHRLPDAYRETLVLRFVQGLT